MCPFCHQSQIGERNTCSDMNNNAIGVVEYELYCRSCGESIAIFSYGEWFFNKKDKR